MVVSAKGFRHRISPLAERNPACVRLRGPGFFGPEIKEGGRLQPSPTVIPTALSVSIWPMPRALFILSFSSIVVLLQDCSLSNQQSQQVQQIGDGTYAIGVSKTSSFMNSSSWTKGLDAAVGKAGDYCHAKGLKLVNTHAVSNSITFRCASEVPTKPQ